MKQMKQTVKHSVENFSKNIAIIEYLIECPPHHERLNNTWALLKWYISQRILPKMLES